jgi:hypothetical protein
MVEMPRRIGKLSQERNWRFHPCLACAGPSAPRMHRRRSAAQGKQYGALSTKKKV